MRKAFENSNWIWYSCEGKDQYVEFCDTFVCSGKNAIVNISCDSDYTLYINGKYASSSQYGDFEHYKIYDTVNIGALLKEGENRVDILAYHCGVATQRYRPYKAGLIYEIVSDGNILAKSTQNTKSRLSLTYLSGRCKFVSTQLGFTFFYDATKENNYGYLPSVCVEKNAELYPRPIKKHAVLEKHPVKSTVRHSDEHYLIDLGSETVGFATLDIISETEQNIKIAFGEHIDDGGVREIIGNRTFSFEYRAKIGQNRFTDYMLRLGCRYLEIFAENAIRINYVGILPQVYEVKEKTVRLDNELDRDIYRICVNTLRLCMMEHYVDCPWREQALYTFDSRNQMLCGYYAFEDKNAEYARANLKLIGNDRRDDGLLSICYPCGTSLAIPSFSLYYLISMKEYMENTGDISLAKEMLPKMISVCDEFFNNMQNGLVSKKRADGIWNFYDWSEYLDGYGNKIGADLIINCLFIMALDALEKMCILIGEKFPYPEKANELRGKIREAFLTRKGYTIHTDSEEYTALGNSLAILSGVERDNAELLCQRLANGDFTEMSLSMKIFKYEALLQTDKEKYAPLVIEEIRTSYKKMLDYGSDTVWETIVGASDFDNAGSLCHGWSAVPVYIYHKLGLAK